MSKPTARSPWVICDIDGVVADARHREHMLTTFAHDTDWKAYTAAGFNDPPIMRMVLLIRQLSRIANIAFITGRVESSKRITAAWLSRVVDIDEFELWHRSNNDKRPAAKVKGEIFDREFEGRLIWMVIEDDGRVVEMYRKLGLYVLQPQDARAGL